MREAISWSKILVCRGVNVTGFWLTRFLGSLDDGGRQRVLAEVLDLLVKGIFKPRAGIYKLALHRLCILQTIQSPGLHE
jgi:hypothetical protein